MILVPLTIALFLLAVLFACMGWEWWAAGAGIAAVLNQGLVEWALLRAPAPPAPSYDRIDTGEPEIPGEDDA